ncbi:MAG TPA: FAD-binding protein, partial [Nitrolancea sp.]
MAQPVVVAQLVAALGRDSVLSNPSELTVYEYDGSDEALAGSHRPDVVVLPQTAQQVQQVVKIARAAGMPVTARGGGTGLAGGAIAVQGGILIALTKMDRILEINTRDRYALVEPGLINLDLSQTTSRDGYFFAPDPSSQRACTIGGNVANNSGGPHCLKYGVT